MAAFLQSYGLGSRLVAAYTKAGGYLPPFIDAQVAGGHLLQICCMHQHLAADPISGRTTVMAGGAE